MAGMLELVLSFPVLILLLSVVILGILMMYIVLFVTTQREPDLWRHDSEMYFSTGNGEERAPFPSLDDPASVSLSLIVPAYNEKDRLPIMLDEALFFLEERLKEDSSFSYEVIVVDDGSRDSTSEVVIEYSKRYGSNKVRLLKFVKNRGKGGAVRMGMLSSRGSRLLFADADGATRIEDLTKLEDALSKDAPDHDVAAISVGSRAHLQDDAVAERTFFRNFLMFGFHFLVWFFCVRGIKDTQCGFKMFTRAAARPLFNSIHVNRWAFDVELLLIAQKLNLPISEVAVNWHEVEGSKLVPFWSWLQMAKDLLLISFRYLFRIWTVSPGTKSKTD
ncbi:dolichyl-phosphate beta-glucosyltransferase-like [Corticium candelabrum]|uniref:dolichyl-phosphate beta-glucosyltransferase-like n=1 Tax=Corticium candelabrum TaxID=121492 RepID=UPI002E258F6C|nr:dolichyl-phosphate beta-glucosyltransferase-like [Corticium candelabrum]